MEYYLALSITFGCLIYITALGCLLYTIRRDAIRQAEAQNDQAIHQNGENPEKTGKRLIGKTRGQLHARGRTIDFNALLAYLRYRPAKAPAYFAPLSNYERDSIEAALWRPSDKAQNDPAIIDLDNAIRQTENTGTRLIDEMRGQLQEKYGSDIDFDSAIDYLRERHDITPAYFAAMSDIERQAIEDAIRLMTLQTQTQTLIF